MSSDIVLRALGVTVCLFTVAYFVTSVSVAALNAVSYNTGPACGQMGCVTLSADARPALEPTAEPVSIAAAFLTFD